MILTARHLANLQVLVRELERSLHLDSTFNVLLVWAQVLIYSKEKKPSKQLKLI